MGGKLNNKTDDQLEFIYAKLGIGSDIEFRDRFGFGASTISGWRQRDNIPMKALKAISEKTGIPIDAILKAGRKVVVGTDGGSFKLSQSEIEALNSDIEIAISIEAQLQRTLQTIKLRIDNLQQ